MAIQTTTFKGARYIVKFHDPIEWADTESYEAIEAVQHEAFTYISKQPVPAGVQIDNDDFWLLWADPNAQMEQLRQLVESYVDDVAALDTLVDAINDALPIADYDSVNTVSAAIDAIKGVLPISDYDSVNTVSAAIQSAIENDGIKARVYETVSDMAEDIALAKGMICHTNGFNTAGDMGAAWYVIDDSGTANGKDVIACGELYAKLVTVDDFIVPEQLGCVRSDATTIVQYALNNYNKVKFVKKNNEPYIITGTLTVGKYSQQLFSDCEDDERLIVFQSESTSSLRYPLFDIKGQGCIFYNLSIYVGNNDVVFSAKTEIADIDAIVKNCFIRGGNIIADIEGRGFHFANNMCAGFTHAINLNWNQAHETNLNNPAGYGQRGIRIENNRFHSFTRDILAVQSGKAFGLVFSGNVMDHGRGYVAIVKDGADSWRVENNTFNVITTGQGASSNAISFTTPTGQQTPELVKDCIIANNVFRSNIDNYWNDETWIPTVTFIRFAAAVENCIVEGNMFDSCTGYAIRADYDIDGLVIANNMYISTSDTAALLEIQSGSADIAAAKDEKYIVIIGNTSKTSGAKVYTVRANYNTTLNHSKITGNVTQDGTQASGIVAGTDCTFDWS